MDHNGGGAGHAPARPVLFAVARARAGGCFTYLTPLWPDARGVLLGLLERDAGDAARQVPTDPPADPWRLQVGQCRYQLDRHDFAPAPDTDPRQAASTAVPPQPTDKEPHR